MRARRACTRERWRARVDLAGDGIAGADASRERGFARIARAMDAWEYHASFGRVARARSGGETRASG